MVSGAPQPAAGAAGPAPAPERAPLSLGILGPLRAADRGRPIPLGPRKQQLVLAILLCSPNAAVPVGTLMDALWDGRPPRTARKNVQVYVCALRGLLAAIPSRPRITREAGGYMIALGPGELDWLLFEERARESRRLWRHEQPAALARELARTLALWRGPVLEGMRDNPVVDAAAQRLEDRVLTTFEDWAEVEVAAGGAAEAIDRIARVASRHPFRERLRMAQMSALCQAGRTTEALAVYDGLRRALAREFGLAPSAALMSFYESLLREGETLPARPPAQPARRLAAGSLLPRDLPGFTGRVRSSQELAAALAGGERLAVLSGRMGVGKTALAVHVAHQSRDAFPDGCLLARLRAPDGSVRPAQQVLAGLWWAIAAPAAAAGPGDAAAWWQRWLATHRALVVLDNARREADVRPLLPEAGDSAVIITSRARLTGLGTAFRMALPPFDLAEAMQLLRRIAGRERVDRDVESAERICLAVESLPLGVRVIGDRLAALSHVPLREYLARVGSPSAVLEELTLGDTTVSDRLAQAALDLPEPARRAYPRLGALPGPVFTLREAASALGLSDGAALRIVEALLESGAVATASHEVLAHSVVYEMPALEHAHATSICRAGPDQAPAVRLPAAAFAGQREA